MKAVWKGAISFGLVQIPIKLYSAIESKAYGFRVLCGHCKTPLKYRRFCPKCKKEVAWENVMKGIDMGKGKFVVLDKKAIAKLKPEKTETIDIVEFVDTNQIDPIYYNNHYYVVPEKTKAPAYYLFRDVLTMAAKTAVGKFVMKDRQHVCAIQSYKNGLLLTSLNYAYEIRDIKKIEELKGKVALKKKELDLAKQLINKFYEKEFDITDFKDTFAVELKKALKKKPKVKVEEVVEKAKKPKKEDLMQQLKASIKR